MENITVDTTEIEVSSEIEVEADGVDTTVEVSDTKEIEVTFDSNEFSIVGDDMVVLTKYEDAPQWMKDVINGLIDAKTSIAVGDLAATKKALDAMLTELEVAKNTYELSIVSSADIDSRITTAIETLNSSLRAADATILNIAQTATTPEEASAIALNTLSASLALDGEIGSTINNLQSAFADLETTTANSISMLESVMEGEISGNAAAMNTIRTYVGINEAGASTGTGLSAYLEASDGTIGGADSQLANDVRVTAEGVESKFAYNSIVNINGIYKKSGFGLTTNYTSGSGTQANPYVSEFWIDASRLKFTNSNQTGRTAPFTIDATGITPQITFNGKVSFTNVTGTSDLVSTANIQNAIANNVTTIDGGKIVTNQVFVNNLNAVGGVVADTITGNALNGTVVNGAVINGARINGSVIKASYLDLDGELEVLTNYHITVAMYNANPSLYTDAVYISADNEYRIPSMSTVRETTISNTISYPATFYGVISSYNTANAGNNLKAVKIRPFFSNQTGFTLFNSTCSDEWFKSSFTYGLKNHFRLSLGSITLIECSVYLEGFSDGNGGNDVTYITFSGAFFSTITHSLLSGHRYDGNRTEFINSVNIGIGTLSLQTIVTRIGDKDSSAPNMIQLIGTLLTGTQEFPVDWTNGRLKFEQLVTPGTQYYYRVDEYTTFALNQSLYINNMI